MKKRNKYLEALDRKVKTSVEINPTMKRNIRLIEVHDAVLVDPSGEIKYEPIILN